MPDRPPPNSIIVLLNDILARLRQVERLQFQMERIVQALAEQTPAYSWQSAFSLATGFGHKLYADRDGTILFIRAERSAGDGTTDATFDVLLNGTSLFDMADPPVVPAGEALGPERIPDFVSFQKGDNFQVEVTDTGGGSGPLRVTIHYLGILGSR